MSSLVAALLGARDSTVVAFGMQVRWWQPCCLVVWTRSGLHGFISVADLQAAAAMPRSVPLIQFCHISLPCRWRRF